MFIQRFKTVVSMLLGLVTIEITANLKNAARLILYDLVA